MASTQLLQLWGSRVLYKTVTAPHQRDISISSLSKQPGEIRRHISPAITYVRKNTVKRLLAAGTPGKVTIGGKDLVGKEAKVAQKKLSKERTYWAIPNKL